MKQNRTKSEIAIKTNVARTTFENNEEHLELNLKVIFI